MPSRDAAYHGIVEAFALDGCPVCRVVDRSTIRYFDALLHENVNDVSFRDELRGARGFCRGHAWMLATRVQGSALGAAIMYRDILNTLSDHLNAVARGTRRSEVRSRGAGLLARAKMTDGKPGTCPACKLSHHEEAMYLGVVLEHAADNEFLARYESSHGICFPHVDALMRRSRNPSQFDALWEAHLRIVARLIAELDLFQHKSDYRRAHEPKGNEADSWRRAIEIAVGNIVNSGYG